MDGASQVVPYRSYILTRYTTPQRHGVKPDGQPVRKEEKTLGDERFIRKRQIHKTSQQPPLLHHDPHTLRINTMTSIEEIMRNLRILHTRLKELELEPSRRKHSREREVEFAIRKTIHSQIISPYSRKQKNPISNIILHPQTRSRPFTKRHDIFA